MPGTEGEIVEDWEEWMGEDIVDGTLDAGGVGTTSRNRLGLILLLLLSVLFY